MSPAAAIADGPHSMTRSDRARPAWGPSTRVASHRLATRPAHSVLKLNCVICVALYSSGSNSSLQVVLGECSKNAATYTARPTAIPTSAHVRVAGRPDFIAWGLPAGKGHLFDSGTCCSRQRIVPVPLGSRYGSLDNWGAPARQSRPAEGTIAGLKDAAMVAATGPVVRARNAWPFS